MAKAIDGDSGALDFDPSTEALIERAFGRARRLTSIEHVRRLIREAARAPLSRHDWRRAMKTYDYDLFVIGAGSGGVRAARVSAAHGARVAVAEEYRVGGTCVIRGCVPKKLLVYGAHFAEDLQDARRFGWEVGRLQLRLADPARQCARPRSSGSKASTPTSSSATRSRSSPSARPSPARTRSRSPTARKVSAGTILIATGAHPVVPDVPGRRARHHLERGVPSRADAEAGGDRRRRLYRQRVRRHLPPVQLPRDAGQSRRPDPAPL